jgi:hypothetical protein
MSRAPA